jgi:short-subunit dehydrogenase
MTPRDARETRSLAGRVAVITGGSSGIGLATARAMAGAGARPVLVSRSPARLRAAAAELAGASGARGAVVIPCDVSDPDAVRALAERVEREVGAPDIVVSNAGVGHWAPVAEMPLERIRAIVDVNFFGAVHCARAFLPGMLARRRGTLVFVSSGLGAIAFPYTAAYVASKHALNGFAGSLRAEVEPLGVDVLLVMPGGTRTGFFEANAYPAEVLSRYLFQRMADPERVGRRIARAVIRRRRRIVIGRFNAIALRLLGALPELEAIFLALVARRLRRWRASGANARESA